MALEPLRSITPEEDLPKPNLKRLRDVLVEPFGVRNVSLTGLFILAAFYTLYFARSFLLPIVLALLLSLLLSPLVRVLRKLHLPEPLGAGIVLLVLLGALGGGIYELSGPAYEWMQKAPNSLRRVEARLRELKRPVLLFGRATEQVAKIADVTAAKAAPVAVAVPAGPSLGARLVGGTTDFVASAAIFFILLYFLLASGDLFLRKLVKVLPSVEDKKRAIEIARQVETDISAYLSTVALINLGLGIGVAGAMALIGLPNPLLWGMMATLTNFIPYLGAGSCYVVLGLAGFLTFDDLPHALLPVGAFLCLNVAEAYFITPMVLGRRLTLNPVVLFLSLTFWGWLWGISGAILAVPIMVVFKIFCDHIEPLAPIGEFLGD
ncbi:MAG TPA: AI-2E family transporter [Thermoanaerobaculia bacterium]|nr:AI-2E family transporter [Thermoanaerobaculia bacterium]